MAAAFNSSIVRLSANSGAYTERTPKRRLISNAVRLWLEIPIISSFGLNFEIYLLKNWNLKKKVSRVLFKVLVWMLKSKIFFKICIHVSSKKNVSREYNFKIIEE